MRIHCLCTVGDEADVLRHTLGAALEWAHAIYVCDNGSSDGSWEMLQDLEREHPKLVLVRREYGPWRSTLWAELANAAMPQVKRGDWWCRLDADEIYVDDPRRFLEGVDRRCGVVYSVSIQYYFTDVDLAAFQREPLDYTERWSPAQMRYYLANWSEPRFMRHGSSKEWTESWGPGFWKLRPAPQRIRLRHYQYRSPPQIERRVRTRTTRAQASHFMHERTSSWVPNGLRPEDLAFPAPAAADGEIWWSRVVKVAALEHDAGDGRFRIDPELLPRAWEPASLLQRLWGRLQVSSAGAGPPV